GWTGGHVGGRRRELVWYRVRRVGGARGPRWAVGRHGHDLLGDGGGGVRGGRRGGGDLLGRIRLAFAGLALGFGLCLLRFIRVGELVGLVEVLRCLVGDGLLDSPDEGVLVELLGPGLVHLLGIGRLALRHLIVFRRPSCILRRRRLLARRRMRGRHRS